LQAAWSTKDPTGNPDAGADMHVARAVLLINGQSGAQFISVIRRAPAVNRVEAADLKADILSKIRKVFSRRPDIEIFRETAGQIMLRARNRGQSDRPVLLMVTVTELRSWG